MSGGRQKIVVLAVMVVLLVGVGILNYTFNNNGSKALPVQGTFAPLSSADVDVMAQGQKSVTTYFNEYFANRESTRADELKYLNELIEDAGTDQATLKRAQEEKLQIIEYMDKEFTLESLLKAKGFEEVAVVFHPSALNVIVGGVELGDADVAQILDTVQRETGEKTENIRIIPIN